MRIYFDDLRRYDPDVPYGVMRMAFRSNGSVRQVRIGLFRSFAFSAQRRTTASWAVLFLVRVTPALRPVPKGVPAVTGCTPLWL